MSLFAPFGDSRRPRQAMVLAATYFGCAALTLQLTRFDGGVAIVWLAGAVLFACLCATPRRHWPLMVVLCLLAGAVAATLFGFGHGVAVPLAAIGIAEAYGAAWILKRACRRFGRFQSVVEVVRFVGVAGLLAPSVGATAAAWLAHVAGGIGYGRAWLDWFAGHALGFLVFAPPVLLALRGELGIWIKGSSRPARQGAVALLGFVAVATGATFGQNEIPIVVLPIAAMLAATFRLGRFGAVASIVILVVIGLGCTLAHRGPTMLLPGSTAFRLQVLQCYFAGVVLILLPVAAELKARRRLVERLQAAETLHRLVLDRTSDIVMRLAVDGSVRYASPSVLGVAGVSAEQVVGRSAFILVHQEDRLRVSEARREAIAAPERTVVAEYRIARPDGTVVWVESHMRATLDSEGMVTGTVGFIREVTERRLLVERLAREAATDPLTGLANRRVFDEALAGRGAGQTSDGKAGCLALFDLDHFKRVNDRFGHATGDAVLVRFAALLRGAFRDRDVVARLGGEEFAVLLHSASLEQARIVCERFRTRLAGEDIVAASGASVRVTVSVGLADLSATPCNAALASADAALYTAKQSGRNRLALAA